MARAPQTRRQLRNILTRRLGYSIASEDTKQWVHDEIDNAIRRLAADVPEAFDRSDAVVDVFKPFKLSTHDCGVIFPVSTSMPAITNDRILEIRRTDESVLPGLDAWLPIVNGTWDGRYWLHVEGADGQRYDIQTREWFVEEAGIGGGDDRYYISLVDPFPFILTEVLTTVTVYQPHVWFPADTRDVHTTVRDSANISAPIVVVNPSNGRRHYSEHVDSWLTVAGAMAVMWRDRKFEMEAPAATPIVLATTSAWSTNFPVVSAKFCYTIAWGSKGTRALGESQRGFNDPLWESPPSPPKTWTDDGGNKSLMLSAYNVDALLGFDHATLAATPWKGKSGLRIRWWIQVTSVVSSQGIYRNIPETEHYYLLGECQPDDALTVGATAYYGALEWDGDDIPDWETTLKPVSGYHGYAYRGAPADDTTLQCSLRRIPDRLHHDYDAVGLKPEGLDALISLASVPFHEVDKNDRAAQRAEDRYHDLAEQLSAGEGNPGGAIIPSNMGGYVRVEPFEEAT